MRKGFAPILIILIIAIVAIVAYLFMVNKSNLSPNNATVTPIPNEASNLTTGWKTFTDTKRGFSFQYPSEWSSPSNTCVSPPTPSNALDLSANCIKTVIFKDNTLPKQNGNNVLDEILLSETNIKVAGLEAKRQIYAIGIAQVDKPPALDPDEGVNNYQVWIYKNGSPYILWLTWIGNGTEKTRAEKIVQILDQVLTTFKLLDNQGCESDNDCGINHCACKAENKKYLGTEDCLQLCPGTPQCLQHECILK
ncbi:hypothetical protein HY045_03850 [Candidatus Woesebacteria bacterium]|nr:hypothetical protein [Candidatus Woesebacteria bacterium]